MGLFKRLFGKQEEASWQSGSPAVVPPAQPFVTGDVQTVALTGQDAREAVQGIEKMTGMDLDGDGKIAGGAAAPPLASMFTAAAAGPRDVVSQLERLAALHASGALTDEEFAAQKAKLLGP